MRQLFATLLAVALALLGCASPPEMPPLPQEGLARTPVVVDPATGERSVEVGVLVGYRLSWMPQGE